MDRVKGWPFTRPHGPGGGAYAVAIIIHLGIATATTAAAATMVPVTSGFIAFGIGATAPVVVKKVAGYVETLIPFNETSAEQRTQDRGDGSGS